MCGNYFCGSSFCQNTFCSFYNIITCDWIVNDSTKIFTIFTSTFSRILNITFLHIFFWLTSTVTVIPNLVWITFFTVKFTVTFACFINFFDSFVLIIKLKTFKFTFSILFGTHILPEIYLRHITNFYYYFQPTCKLIIKGNYLSPTWFKSIKRSNFTIFII